MKDSTCPKCTASSEENDGKKSRLRSFVSLAIGIVFLIIGFTLEKLDPVYSSLSWSFFQEKAFYSSYAFVAFLFYSFAYAYLMIDLFRGMIRELKEGEIFSEYTLMSVATAGAFGLGEFPESILVILFNIVGEMLEDYATEKSSASIRSLVNSMPLYAHVVRDDGSIEESSPEKLPVDTVLEIRPGEKIAVDGSVLQGETSLDLSSINGESLPKDVKAGDPIYSGSICLSYAFRMKTSKLYQDSTLSKIMDLVENEQSKRSKSEKFIQRFSKVYTPAVMLLSLAVFLFGYGFSGWVWAGAQGGEGWLYKALSILLISCPCALVIAVPIAFFAGIGTASRLGILIKGSLPLENLAKSRDFVFDKTGTLTKGDFVLKNHPDGKALEIAASLESKSSHPLAKAIVKANSLPLLPAEDFHNIPGYGIEGTVEGKTYVLGSPELLRDKGVAPFPEEDTPFKVLYLGEEGKEKIASFIVCDEVKPQAKEALEELKAEKAKTTIMLSGDDERIAQEVGKEIRLDVVVGSLLPEEKLTYVQKYAAQDTLCYVGDGINDSPALLAADVGVAMGALGSDAAIEAADIVVMDDDLKKVAEGKRLAKKTMRTVYGGILFALLVKTLVMILVALGYCDGFAMILGTLSDTGVMALCVLNSLRLMLYKTKYIPQPKKRT
jgi:Cd2+/Zn2+-exporting ATPase